MDIVSRVLNIGDRGRIGKVLLGDMRGTPPSSADLLVKVPGKVRWGQGY